MLGLEQGSGLQSGKISALGFSYSLCCSALAAIYINSKTVFSCMTWIAGADSLGFSDSVCPNCVSKFLDEEFKIGLLCGQA